MPGSNQSGRNDTTSKSSEDLDALLDEAMDIVDEQERQHDANVKARQSKLEADLQQVLDSTCGGDADAGDMMQMLQRLLQHAGGDNDVLDDAAFENFKKDVKALLGSLEGVDSLADEDQVNLSRVKDMLAAMDNDDEEKANEILSALCKEEGAENGGAPSNEDVNIAMKRCMDALQKVSDVSLPEGESARETLPSNADNQAPMIPQQLSDLLLDAILDPELLKTITLMRDAYGPCLSSCSNKLSESDKKRFLEQHNVTKRICQVLGDGPLNRSDDTRVLQLLGLMDELSKLGDPPAELAVFGTNTSTPA